MRAAFVSLVCEGQFCCPYITNRQKMRNLERVSYKKAVKPEIHHPPVAAGSILAHGLIKKIFCKHKYQKISFMQEQSAGCRYSVRLYKCSICGKEVWVDGRSDYIEQRDLQKLCEEPASEGYEQKGDLSWDKCQIERRKGNEKMSNLRKY